MKRTAFQCCRTVPPEARDEAGVAVYQSCRQGCGEKSSPGQGAGQSRPEMEGIRRFTLNGDGGVNGCTAGIDRHERPFTRSS